MKKRILFLTLALLMLLSACTTPADTASGTNANQSNVKLTVMGDSSPMPGFDAQNKYASFLPMSSFQEADGFYFGNVKGGNFLHYYDISTGISDYLCADPSCLHNDETCGAYTRHGVSAFWYNGQRWWISDADSATNRHDYYLYRSDLTGINQKIVKRLDWNTVIMAYNPQQYAIHRGNIFFLGKSNTVDGVNIDVRYTLQASSLDDSEEFSVIFDLTRSEPALQSMRFAGTKIYYALQTWAEDTPTELTVTTYDVATKEYETVYKESGIQMWIGEPWVTENGEIYLCGFDSNYTVHFWKLENNQRVELASWTGEKYDLPYVSDNVVINTTWIDGVRGLEVRDFSGNVLVCTDILFPEEISGIEGDPNKLNFSILGGDRDKVIMNLSKGDQSHTLLLDIRDGVKITHLWGTVN